MRQEGEGDRTEVLSIHESRQWSCGRKIREIVGCIRWYPLAFASDAALREHISDGG